MQTYLKNQGILSLWKSTLNDLGIYHLTDNHEFRDYAMRSYITYRLRGGRRIIEELEGWQN